MAFYRGQGWTPAEEQGCVTLMKPWENGSRKEGA